MIGEKNLGIWLRVRQFIGAKLGLNQVNPGRSGLFPATSQGSDAHVVGILPLESH